MQRTILTLISGAAIGAGTTLTLPDGETAQAVTPTAADIYNAEEVQSLKLTMSDDGAVARYIIQKSSDIQGVASYTSSGEKEKQQNVFDAVSTQAEDVCNADP